MQINNMEGSMAYSHRQLEDAATKFLKAKGFNADGRKSSGKDGGKQWAFERRLCLCATGRLNKPLRIGR